MDIPPINDFLVGYIEGAQSVNPDVKVISTYTGDYYDPAKGKEHGIVQFDQVSRNDLQLQGRTADIEASVEKDKKMIGVDSDQAAAYAENGGVRRRQNIL